MRLGLALASALLGLWLVACKEKGRSPERGTPPKAKAASSAPMLERHRELAPISSETLSLSRDIQAHKLRVVPERLRLPRVAFGDGVVAQLTANELVVRSLRDFEVQLRRPVEGPRAVVPLANGTVLATGAHELVRFEPASGRAKALARLVMLPGSALFPDAVLADRVWVFDRGGTSSKAAPSLSSIPLEPVERGVSAPGLEPAPAPQPSILLPNQRLELEPGGSNVLGVTREGVWLHWGASKVERFGPGGARLSALKVPELPGLLWALPARRLDQSYLVDEAGGLSKALVSPSYRRLSGIRLSGPPLSADVGDEGRLIAVVVVAGAGPTFELQLFDAELRQLAKAPLPAEAPTGRDDWVKVVTENQGVSVAARQPLVAVGGPARLLIFDARAQQVFPSSSQ